MTRRGSAAPVRRAREGAAGPRRALLAAAAARQGVGLCCTGAAGAVRPLLSRTPEADSWHSGGNADDATSGVGFHGGRGWGARGRPSSTSPPLSDS